VTYLTDAKAHLDKAREFLESARDEYSKRRHLLEDDEEDDQNREP
jgi:hypothetical protein